MNLLLFLALAIWPASFGQAQDNKQPSHPLLERSFRADLSRDQLAALGADASLEKVRDAMTPEQRNAARARLTEAERDAKTPADLKEIAKGYLLLDEKSPDAGRSVIRVAERLREMEPDRSDSFTLAASGLQQMGDYPAAAEWAKKALELDPNDNTARAVYMLSVGRVRRGGPSLAGVVGTSGPTGQTGSLAPSDWAVPEKDVSPEALSLMQQAVEARRGGDFERTRRLAQAAMNADPASAGVQKFFSDVGADHRKHTDTMEYLRLSRAALDAGRGAEAVEWAQKAADRSQHPTVNKILELTRQKATKLPQTSMRPVGEEKKAPAGGLPLLPIGAALGLGLIGYGIHRARKSGETENDASASNAAQKPGFFSDPAGMISNLGLRAKIFIADHPYTSLGVGLGALVLTAGLAGPSMLAGSGGVFASGGGAAALAPAAASVAAPAASVTIAQAGPAAAAGALVLMAGDSKGNASKADAGEGGIGRGNEKVEHPNGIYEGSPKHGRAPRSSPKGEISPGPTNGQEALDRSVQIKPTALHRIGVDPANNEIVVLNRTREGIFHGHVRTWEALTDQMRKALIDSGLADGRGRILKP